MRNFKDEFCSTCPRHEQCYGWILELYKWVSYQLNYLLCMTYIEIIGPSDEPNTPDDYKPTSICAEMGMPYEALLATCFFGLCKSWMLSLKGDKKYIELLRQKFPDENLDSADMHANTVYRKRLRYFNKITSLNNLDKASELFTCNEDVFNLIEFVMSYRENRDVRDEYSTVTPHSRGFQRDILSKMYTYELPRSHKYTHYEFCEDLKRIEELYQDIEENSKSYFEKCLKYSTLEHLTHYETAYKFLIFLYDRDKLLHDKNELLQYATYFRHVKDEDNNNELVEFPFILSLEYLMIDFFGELDLLKFLDKDKLPLCSTMHLGMLTTIYHNIINKFFNEEEIKVNFHISECPFAEAVFENYIGRGQHISRDKDLSPEIVKDMMKIYINDSPKGL